MARVRRVRLGLIGVLSLLVLGTTSCSRGRDDAQVASDVQNRICADRRLQMTQIQVRASNGIVTLSGVVGSAAERVATTQDAAQVEGVKVVVNNLRVIDPNRQSPTTAVQKPPASVARTGSRSKARISLETRVLPVAPPLDRGRHPVLQGGNAQATTASTSPSDSHSAQEKAPAGTLITSQASFPTRATTDAALSATTEKVTVPDGSVLSVRLLESVNSDTNQPGDKFLASLASPVMVGDRVVIPAEAGLQGKIVEVRSTGRFAGRSSVILELTRLAYNGKIYQLRTSRYSKQGPSRDTRSAGTIGGGAGVGAILGAILGGGRGAAIGAVIGAGVGTGVQAATKGAQVRLPAESVLSFRLATPLAVTPSSALEGAQNTGPGSSQDPFSADRPALKRRPSSGSADPSPDTGSPDPAPGPPATPQLSRRKKSFLVLLEG